MNRGLENVFVFAARYAHHRQTGAAWVVINALKEHWHEIDDSARDQIISETTEAAYNKDEWENFVAWAIGE